MTEVEKKGIGKAKVGLVVSAVLIVILAVSNVWSNTNLQNQINTLNNDKNNLQSQVNTLQSQIDSLNITYLGYVATHGHTNSEYDDLQTENNNLRTEINSLKAPQLHKVNVGWSDHHPWFASPYISISGCIFNSGTYSAYNVVLTVKIYDSADTLLKSEELIFGTISGKSYKNFDTTIEYSGNAYYVLRTLTYD